MGACFPSATSSNSFLHCLSLFCVAVFPRSASTYVRVCAGLCGRHMCVSFASDSHQVVMHVWERGRITRNQTWQTAVVQAINGPPPGCKLKGRGIYCISAQLDRVFMRSPAPRHKDRQDFLWSQVYLEPQITNTGLPRRALQAAPLWHAPIRSGNR